MEKAKAAIAEIKARGQLKKLLKASGLTVEDLIEGTKVEREGLFKETYGRKKKLNLLRWGKC